MSIGKRLFNMARAELNALLDRAVASEGEGEAGRDPDEDLYRRFSLDELTDAELEAEIERRYRARQGARSADRKGSSPAGGRTGADAGGRSKARREPAKPDEELRRAYAALEVPYGADFATVRKSYRALMRKYHPDRHGGSPEKQRAATQLAQQLTLAYKLVEKHARGG